MCGLCGIEMAWTLLKSAGQSNMGMSQAAWEQRKRLALKQVLESDTPIYQYAMKPRLISAILRLVCRTTPMPSRDPSLFELPSMVVR